MSRLRFIFISAALAIPCIALAQGATPVICGNLPGCGQPIENTVFTTVLPFAVDMLIRLAAGLSLVWIVVAGVQMLLSDGDDSKAGTAKKNVLHALGGLALSLVAANIVAFVTTENYGQGDPNLLFGPNGILASVIRIILVLFNVAFVIVIILAGMKMLLGNGSADEFKKGGAVIKWAIVGAVLVNLAKTIIQAFLNLNF